MTIKTNHQFLFQWERQSYSIAYDTIGQGKPVLLLPAFSTVSSREEMQEIAPATCRSLSGCHARLVGIWRIRSPCSGLSSCTAAPGARLISLNRRFQNLWLLLRLVTLQDTLYNWLNSTPKFAPPYSKREMQAMAAVPGIRSLTLPGTLGMHEEYAVEVALSVLPFLDASQPFQF